VVEYARVSIEAISEEETSAAKLLLIIFWTFIEHPSHDRLIKFLGAPEQYLGWVQGIKLRNKGCLKGTVSEEGQKLFRVANRGNFSWLSDNHRYELAKDIIGELPTMNLELI
jgi:hypothetical protein